MSMDELPYELAETLANWFMIYGKCEKCMIEDNSSFDAEGLDVSEAVPEAECRRCFSGTMEEQIRQNIDPTITTKFCPTCGKSKDG